MKKLILISAVISLVACTSAPTGPTIAVMPAQGKPFEIFQKEDQQCRQFASGSVEGTSNAALKEGMTSAAVAAALAVIGGGSHQGVGTGAGLGLLGGSAIGASNAANKQNQSQSQYNTAYIQCMYAHGNQVPSYPAR